MQNKDTMGHAIRSILPLVRQAVRRYVDDPDDCQDVVQEVLLKLWKSRGRLPALDLLPDSYIWKTAYTSAVDLYRKQMSERHFADRSCALVPPGDFVDANGEVRCRVLPLAAPEASDPFVAEAVESALSLLSPKLRQALLLSVDGYSYADIARVQEANIGTVRSRLHYARKYTREALEAVVG